MYQRKFKVLPSDALVSIYPAMPQASTSTRFDIFFVFKCWITRRTLRKVLLRESANTNGFKPVRTWFCATRFSAAPAASYYFTIDQTFWPIYGPRAGCLLKNKERFMCVCLYLQWGNIGPVGPVSNYLLAETTPRLFPSFQSCNSHAHGDLSGLLRQLSLAHVILHLL